MSIYLEYRQSAIYLHRFSHHSPEVEPTPPAQQQLSVLMIIITLCLVELSVKLTYAQAG
jgi:hypothetical protein